MARRSNAADGLRSRPNTRSCFDTVPNGPVVQPPRGTVPPSRAEVPVPPPSPPLPPPSPASPAALSWRFREEEPVPMPDPAGRILVVDDEADIREALEMVLKYEKYAVATAPDGEKALALLAKDPPDAVLLDVKMPGRD